MRETDLAKSLPAARCEMDSGTVAGKAQPRRASVGPSQSPARPPVHPSQGKPTSPTLHQHWQGPDSSTHREFRLSEDTGFLLGLKDVIAAQPFHQGSSSPSNPRQDRSTQPVCLLSFATTNLRQAKAPFTEPQ